MPTMKASQAPLGDKTNVQKSPIEKKARTIFTEEEKFVFEAAYDCDHFFAQNPKNRLALALTFNRTERQIKKWFQNRRALDRKDKNEDEEEDDEDLMSDNGSS
ncbi:hypothetical protein QR680_017830 [Steinernema hermaphroditum]|nr:hypothetical protein QR680_017830 [Steinernema hermaphroditum]